MTAHLRRRAENADNIWYSILTTSCGKRKETDTKAPDSEVPDSLARVEALRGINQINEVMRLTQHTSGPCHAENTLVAFQAFPQRLGRPPFEGADQSAIPRRGSLSGDAESPLCCWMAVNSQ